MRPLIRIKNNNEEVRMNWDAVGAIGEIAGAVAVVLTLFYLASQIRQNTAALNTEARRASRDGGHAELFTMVGNPELVLSIVREEPLTDREQVALSAFLFAMMRTREYAWGQYRDGAIDDAQWQTEENVIRFVLDASRTRDWWITFGRAIYSDEFSGFVDELLVDCPPTDMGWQKYATWDNAPPSAASVD